MFVKKFIQQVRILTVHRILVSFDALIIAGAVTRGIMRRRRPGHQEGADLGRRPVDGFLDSGHVSAGYSSWWQRH